MKVKNVAINPIFTNLQYILDGQSEEGFALSHVVHVSEYQMVLIFMKPDAPQEISEESEVVFSQERPENGSYL